MADDVLLGGVIAVASNVDEPGVTLSLLEKLTDENPGRRGQNSLAFAATVQELRDSVLRHLDILINTRHDELDVDPAYEESNSSVLSFGVIDFTTLVLSNPVDREKLRRSVALSIRMFEPRLSHVNVSLADWAPSHTGLTLNISAELRVEPENEPVAFSAVLAKDTRRFSVSGGRD